MKKIVRRVVEPNCLRQLPVSKFVLVDLVVTETSFGNKNGYEIQGF